MNNAKNNSTNNLLSITSKPWFIVLMFIVCYPIGIILLWIHNKLNIVVRIILTILLSLWFFLMIITGVGIKSTSFMTCFSEVIKNGNEHIATKKEKLIGVYFSKKGRYLKLNSDNTFEYYTPSLINIYKGDKWDYLSKLTVDFNDSAIYEADVSKNNDLKFKILMNNRKYTEEWDEFVKIDNDSKFYTKEELDEMMLNPSDYNLPFEKTGWVQTGENWNYYENGVMQKGIFLNDTAFTDQTHIYYVDENGNMLRNTKVINEAGIFEIDENGWSKAK